MMLKNLISQLDHQVIRFHQVNNELNDIFNSIEQWISQVKLSYSIATRIKHKYYAWILNNKMQRLHCLHDEIIKSYQSFGVGGRFMGHYDIDLELISGVVYGYNDKSKRLLELKSSPIKFTVNLPANTFNQVPSWHD